MGMIERLYLVIMVIVKETKQKGSVKCVLLVNVLPVSNRERTILEANLIR